MAITKAQAVSLAYHDMLHYTGNGPCTRTVGPRGGVTTRIVQARVTGACKVWVTRPADYRLPVVHGMRDYGAVTPANAAHWHTAADCPLATGG